MKTFWWNVLRELSQNIERWEDLKIPFRARFEVVGLRIRKGSTGLLLGLVDNLPGIGYLD
jgi:hypothetical protein